MSGSQKSKANVDKIFKSKKELQKISNKSTMKEQETTQVELQKIQLGQTQRNKIPPQPPMPPIPPQQPYSLSWLLSLKKEYYLSSADQIQTDLKGEGQMLEDFIKLSQSERESILRTLKIIIKKINNRQNSAVYQVFLEQLEKKKKQNKQRSLTTQNKSTLIQAFLGKKCHAIITIIFAVILSTQNKTLNSKNGVTNQSEFSLVDYFGSSIHSLYTNMDRALRNRNIQKNKQINRRKQMTFLASQTSQTSYTSQTAYLKQLCDQNNEQEETSSLLRNDHID